MTDFNWEISIVKEEKKEFINNNILETLLVMIKNADEYNQVHLSKVTPNSVISNKDYYMGIVNFLFENKYFVSHIRLDLFASDFFIENIWEDLSFEERKVFFSSLMSEYCINFEYSDEESQSQKILNKIASNSASLLELTIFNYINDERLIKDFISSRSSSYNKESSHDVTHYHELLKLEWFQNEEFMEKISKNYVSNYKDMIDGFPATFKNHVQDNFQVNDIIKFLDVTRLLPFSNNLIPKCLHDRENLYSFLTNIKALEQNNKVLISKLYNNIPQELKNDKEILLAFLNITPSIIKDISGPLINDLEIINFSVRANVHNDKMNYFKIKDKDLILELVKNNRHVLSEKKCPKGWFNKDVFMKLGKYWDDYVAYFNKEDVKVWKTEYITMSTLLKNANYNSNAFVKFPAKWKKDMNLAIEFLTGNYDQNVGDSDKLKEACRLINKDLWLNKDFCKAAILIDINLLSFVPEEMFTKKDFILTFTKRLDVDSNNNIFKMLPEKVLNFFQANNVTNNYNAFMEKIFLEQDMKSIKTTAKSKIKL